MATMNRREFLFLGAAGVFVGSRVFGVAADAKPVVRFGMVTDLHYADIDPDPAPCGVGDAGIIASRCGS